MIGSLRVVAALAVPAADCATAAASNQSVADRCAWDFGGAGYLLSDAAAEAG